MSTFLIRSATSQSSSYSIVLTKLSRCQLIFVSLKIKHRYLEKGTYEERMDNKMIVNICYYDPFIPCVVIIYVRVVYEITFLATGLLSRHKPSIPFHT